MFTGQVFEYAVHELILHVVVKYTNTYHFSL